MPEGKNKIKFELVKNAPKYAVSHRKIEVITLSDMGFLQKGNENLSTVRKDRNRADWFLGTITNELKLHLGKAIRFKKI